jgi:hypothetical protein
MNCPEAHESLHLWLDGEEGALRQPGLHEHLVLCLDCRELFDAARRLRAGLTAFPSPAVSADFASRTLRQLHRRKQPWWLNPGWVAAAAAAILVVIGMSLILSLREGGRGRPEMAQPGVSQPEPGPGKESRPSANGSRAFSSAMELGASRLASAYQSNLTRRILPSVEAARQLRQGAAHGLAPVAQSAEKASAMFKRLTPSLALSSDGS